MIGVRRVSENMDHDDNVAETSSVHCETNTPFSGVDIRGTEVGGLVMYVSS